MSKQKNLFEETSKFCQKFHGFKSMSKQNKLFEETSKFCQMFHGLLFDPSGCDGLSNEFMCLNKLAQNERGENSSDLINILFEVILVLQKSNNEAYNDLKTQIKETFEYNNSQNIIKKSQRVQNAGKGKKVTKKKTIMKKRGGNPDNECKIVQDMLGCLYNISINELIYREKDFPEKKRSEVMSKIRTCVNKNYNISPVFQYYFEHVIEDKEVLNKSMGSIINAHIEYLKKNRKQFVNKYSALDVFIFTHLMNILMIMSKHVSNTNVHPLLNDILNAYEMYYPLAKEVLNHVLNIHIEFKKNKNIFENFLITFNDYHRRVSQILCKYNRYIKAENKMQEEQNKELLQRNVDKLMNYITDKDKRKRLLNESIDRLVKYVDNEFKGTPSYGVLLRNYEISLSDLERKDFSPLGLVFPESLHIYIKNNNIEFKTFPYYFKHKSILESVPDSEFKLYGPTHNAELYEKKIKDKYLYIYKNRIPSRKYR